MSAPKNEPLPEDCASYWGQMMNHLHLLQEAPGRTIAEREQARRIAAQAYHKYNQCIDRQFGAAAVRRTLNTMLMNVLHTPIVGGGRRRHRSRKNVHARRGKTRRNH